MSPEPITFAVGTAAAKAIAQIWLKGAPGLPTLAGAQIDMLLERRLASNWFERRRARQLFDSIADDVAERLLSVYEREFAHVPDHEQQAAVHAAARTVEAGALTLTDIVGANADAREIERRVRSADSSVLRSERLSRDAEELYYITLSATCDHIAAVALTLPEFGSEASRELLQRSDRMLGLIREALDRQSQTHEVVSRLAGDPNRFERRYLEHVVSSLDRLRLFGLGGTEPAPEYSLSIAYITLTSTQPQGLRGSTAAADADDVRVDEVLGSSPRLVVRGEAGSGKTTLLQWLAVTTASAPCRGALAPLSGCVPFMLPLRQFVGRELPQPPEFVTPVAAPLRGLLPQGWVEDQLETGRALVLIDGVDELPTSERAGAREWLRQLCRAYPGARYIITSRPAAVRDRWLSDDDFDETELQPMDEADVDALIEHWHDAIVQLQPSVKEAEHIAQLRANLRQEILRNPAMRGLATSPLLCAVLCTLHRRSGGRLPPDRLELYRQSLGLLLEQRDEQRGVPVPREYLELKLRQRESLLSDLAYWLLRNGHLDASREDFLRAIEHKLRQMPGTEIAAETVLDSLVDRSGVVREPEAGRVEFIHRTFQEYLAALEAVQRNDIGALVRDAPRDEWREVIVIAAGLANDEQRADLIGGLLDGGNNAATRRQAKLLAVACMETAATIPSRIQDRIAAAVRETMPPKTNLEARAMAQAGDSAVPLLAGYAGAGVGIVRPCIRALALIGTAAALDALRQFGTDRRVSVVRDLQRSWSFFDPDEYARCVLAESPLRDGKLKISSVRLVASLRHLRHLSELEADLSGSDAKLDVIANVDQLVRLRVRRSTTVRDLAPLNGHAGIRRLELQDCPRLVSLAGLGGTGVRDLVLTGTTELSDLEVLAGVSTLERVVLNGVGPLDLRPLYRHPSLKHLEVSAGDEARPLDLDLSELPAVETLVLRHHAGLRALHGSSPAIRVIDVTNSALEVLELGDCPQLQELLLSSTSLRSLGDIGSCKALRSVDLHHTQLLDAEAVRRLRDARPALELAGVGE